MQRPPSRRHNESCLWNSPQDLNIGTELLEQALPFLTNDNLDLGCVVIEHAAIEKALPTIDEASCEVWGYLAACVKDLCSCHFAKE